MENCNHNLYTPPAYFVKSSKTLKELELEKENYIFQREMDLNNRIEVLRKISISDFGTNIAKNKQNKAYYEGRTYPTNRSGEFVVLEYFNIENVLIQFKNTGFRNIIKANNLNSKEIKDPYAKIVCGIGCIGIGPYTASINRKTTPEYHVWSGMLDRCYNPYKHPSYMGCEVHPYWHNFQNFAVWYNANYYSISNDIVALDKDILFKGNKIYGPVTCCFVPDIINGCFVKRNAMRGDTPVGVCYNKSRNKYEAWLAKHGITTFLGRYSTPEEAFAVYKQAKEQYIKELAELYRGIIPEHVYYALMNYQVEIND